MDSGPEFVPVNSTSAAMKSSPKTRDDLRTYMWGEGGEPALHILAPRGPVVHPLEDGQVLPDEGLSFVLQSVRGRAART
jgi:hypothetical protein